MRLGLALGGGFARGLAHIGVVRVPDQNKNLVHCIARGLGCLYPGMFQPVRCGGPLLAGGATQAISLHLPMQCGAAMPTNMFHVTNRCFQILHSRTEITWRRHSGLVIEPDVRGMEWDAFDSAAQLLKAAKGCPPTSPNICKQRRGGSRMTRRRHVSLTGFLLWGCAGLTDGDIITAT
jgi:hypothetical protein